jgi:hypothetical protein
VKRNYFYCSDFSLVDCGKISRIFHFNPIIFGIFLSFSFFWVNYLAGVMFGFTVGLANLVGTRM